MERKFTNSTGRLFSKRCFSQVKFEHMYYITNLLTAVACAVFLALIGKDYKGTSIKNFKRVLLPVFEFFHFKARAQSGNKMNQVSNL